MTRRTWLMIAGALAGTPWAKGQYVLPAQAPPETRFPPTPEQTAEINRKMAQLQDRLSALQQKNVADDLLAEIEIFHKAAEWIGRYREYYTKNSVAQTIALLDTGIARAGELEAGKPTWPTATGPVIRAYRSRVDGSVQPYIAYVPASYDRSKPVRMDIFLHGTNRGMVEVQFMSHTAISYGGMPAPAAPDYIQLELLGRTNNAYRWAGEADVLEAVESAKRNYTIDENRVLLRGFSMGGSGTWHLGLQHPDHWAAIEPGAGFNDTIRYGHFSNLPPQDLKSIHIYDAQDYSLNVFQLPTAAYTGEIDGQKQNLDNFREELAKSGFLFKPEGLNFSTTELPVTILVGPNTPHRWEAESKKRSDAFIDAAAKKGRTDPDHIRFVTYTTRYNRCFWVTVDGLDQHYQRAEVDARRSPSDGTIEVKTTNVSGLALKCAGVKKISIDGHSFTASGGEMQFMKRGGAWKSGTDTSVRKRHGLQGPIDDAFMDSFLCVRPTGPAVHDLAGRYAQETLDAFVEDFSKFFRGQVRMKDAAAVTAADIADHHLIVFGDPQNNQILARALPQLPLQWNARELSLGGKAYDPARHVVAMVYPNPLNPRRYIVVNSGHSFHRNEMAATNASLFPRFGDYAVLQLRQPVDQKVESEILVADYFDEEWKLPHA